MIEQVKSLLAERRITRAVIIDDAYDDLPRAGDIEDSDWDRFFDDITQPEETRLAAAYGQREYDSQEVSALRRDQLFVEAAWNQRDNLPPAIALFAEFVRVQAVKRVELADLQSLLQTQLGLTCQTCGRDDMPAIADADIIFLDLFLGFSENQDAVERATARVKTLIDQRRGQPPSVLLMSASPRLTEDGPRLRDGAELLGCQFRMLRKSDLTDGERVAERLYDLIASYQDSQRLNAFVLAWEAALRASTTKFLRSIRALDLADYANLQALVLEAEGEPVGDYVLELYDFHLHSVLEGDEVLVRAAKALNEISWKEYPPAQFMPSVELIDMMDGALFQSETRTRIEAEMAPPSIDVRLGDVFLGPAPSPAAGGPETSPPPASPRSAFVVLSQACDLKHADAEQLLVMRGTVRPYTARQHDKRRARTPVMKVGDSRYSIEWDPTSPETWAIDGLPAKLDEGVRRVRRFRTQFALQLQQDFIRNLGRVGTLAAVPARFAAGVRIFLKRRDKTALLLGERHPDAGDGAYLVGRTADGDPREWLLLSEAFREEFSRNLRAVSVDDLPATNPAPLATVRDDPAFYRRFRAGLALRQSNTNGLRPFAGTTHDVVQIVTRRVCTANEPVQGAFNGIVIEVDLE